MPAALDVDREQVRMLVLAVGVREAARQMGLNEKTVLHWSHTGNWLADTRARPASLPRPASQVPRSVCSVKPADALQAVLQQGVEDTKIGFTKYAARMARQAAERGELEEAPLYKAVADIHGKMHPEQTQANQLVINLALLGQESLPDDGPTPITHTLADEPGDDY